MFVFQNPDFSEFKLFLTIRQVDPIVIEPLYITVKMILFVATLLRFTDVMV